MSSLKDKARARKLFAAATELLAIARDLENGQQQSGSDAGIIVNPAPNSRHVELARQEYQDRRQRARAFDDDSIFGEPAWDILLDLFIAANERKKVSVTSACIASACASTTALRWLNVLEKQQLVARDADPGDLRRTNVRLTAKGFTAMTDYLSCSFRRFTTIDWPAESESTV